MRIKTNVAWKGYCLAITLLLFSLTTFSQRTITGRVVSKNDNGPVPLATVAVKGSHVAAASGQDGSFILKLPNNLANGSLVVSAVGFVTVAIPLAGQDNLGDIILAQANNTLNDVIVTGYTVQKKKDITGAVSTVDVTDAKKIPMTSSEQLLQGQASGVTVMSSGGPGAPSAVFVRGVSNFGQSQPLYVVDGAQVADMSFINPNDIESISVLKDAGAAAIYGVSGGNGVVVITTKKGRSGKTSISYDAYFGNQQPLSGNVWHLMNPEQQSQLAFTAGDGPTEALYPGGPGVIPTYGYHGTNAVPTFGTAGVTNDPNVLQYYLFDAINPQNDFLIQKFATGAGTDWFHSVFKPAFEQNHTLSASGGNDRSAYYFSLNYLDQNGTLMNTYEKRYSARLNTVFNVKNHVRFGENGMVTYRENNGGYNGDQQQEGGSIAFTYREMPIIPIFDVKGNFGGGYDGPGGEPLGNGSNPYAIMSRESTNNAHFVTVEGLVFAEADFLKHFTARTAFGGRLWNQYYWNITYNPYEDYESHTNPNSATENEQMSSNHNWTNTLVYKNEWGKHSLQVLGGFELKGSSGREFHASAQSFFTLDPNIVQLQYGTPVNAPTSTIWQPTSTESFFGRVDYAYNDKYLLGATIRRDGYSIFYQGRQWGTFPSVSAGWRISDEDFMKDVSWMNSLKLRASYGTAGNNGNIAGNNAYTSYSLGTGSSFYSITGSPNSLTSGFYQNQIGSPTVTWETDKITNIGLDGILFNNHWDFSVEWYKKSISGLLFAADLLTDLGGAAFPVVNVGDVQNTGVDISTTYHGRINQDFTFNITANITTYKSLITSIPGSGYFDYGASRDLDIVRNEQGHPISEFFGYKTTGIYQSDAAAAKGPTYAGAKAGSFSYANTNGDTVIDANDRTWLGNPNPQFTYGLNLNAAYKGFDFTMVLYGSQGNKDFNYVKYWTDFYSTFQGGKNLDLYNKAAIVKNGTVTNPGATLPAASFGQAMGSSTISSFYVENGSFLKCRVAQIGYSISPSLIKKAGIDKLHFYVQATNLFTITKYTGLDPELVPSINNNGSSNGQNPGTKQNAAFGIDYGAYPTNQKVFLIGINASF
ncbi:MAG TPA: SusC/RagA family TonB-linked outer membrane protein [Puia sp.]|nr:SusC/RagA family TonB-linked outer membrane protein [Puia sp.]